MPGSYQPNGALGEQFEAIRQAVLGRERVSSTRLAKRSRPCVRSEAKRHGRCLLRRADSTTSSCSSSICVWRPHPRKAVSTDDGLVATLEAGANRGLIDPTVAQDLADATRLWQNFDGFMRMAAVEGNPTLLSPEEQSTLAEACDAAGLEDLGSVTRCNPATQRLANRRVVFETTPFTQRDRRGRAEESCAMQRHEVQLRGRGVLGRWGLGPDGECAPLRGACESSGGVVPSRCPGSGACPNTGDHKGRPYDSIRTPNVQGATPVVDGLVPSR